jgi:hypothetical protein
MKMRDVSWALAVALAICVPVCAQNQSSDSQQAAPSGPIQPLGSVFGGHSKLPAPAARGVSLADESQVSDPSQVTPDANTLAGAQPFGLGSLQHSRNIFDPSLKFTELGQTVTSSGGQTGFTPVSILGASLNLDRTWGENEFTALYNGGDTLSSNSLIPHGQFHDLSLTEQILWARWHILLRDDFAAAPGAIFAGTGMGGPGLLAQSSAALGASLTNVGQEFIPADTVETGNALRYRNSILGQVEYSFSRRSAFTLSGSYGLLEFPYAGYISSHMLNAQAGYDYELDPKDSIAVLASYGKIDYTGTSDSTRDYMAALAFGRKITGRVAFQVSAGPQRIQAMNSTGNFQLWFAAANSALSYERRRGGMSLAFSRGVSAGSGVFLGSTTNTFSSSAHYLFARFWTGTVNGGYSMNTSLAPAGVATTTFDNWFFGASLGRRLGQHAEMNLNYGLQRQNSPAVCPVTSCGVSGFQQTVGMTVNWHLRPAG